MKVAASRWSWEEPDDPEEFKTRWVPEKVLRRHYRKRPEKVLQQARAYDFAYAKGRVTDSDDEEEKEEKIEGPHDEGDANVVSRPKDTETDTTAGVTPDASKDTTTKVAMTSSTSAEPGSAGTQSGDKDPEKDTSTSEPASKEKPTWEKTPQGDIERQNDELAQNPWNAVCVVGLRVFSKDEKCSIRVVRPFRQETYVPKPKPDDGKTKKDSK